MRADLTETSDEDLVTLYQSGETRAVEVLLMRYRHVAQIKARNYFLACSCKLEPSVRRAEPGRRYQFERLGYFCVDKDSTADRPVFNRTVGLRDTFAKEIAKG